MDKREIIPGIIIVPTIALIALWAITKSVWAPIVVVISGHIVLRFIGKWIGVKDRAAKWLKKIP